MGFLWHVPCRSVIVGSRQPAAGTEGSHTAKIRSSGSIRRRSGQADQALQSCLRGGVWNGLSEDCRGDCDPDSEPLRSFRFRAINPSLAAGGLSSATAHLRSSFVSGPPVCRSASSSIAFLPAASKRELRTAYRTNPDTLAARPVATSSRIASTLIVVERDGDLRYRV